MARADNANGARAKLREAAVIPVSTPLVRLYSEYMHAEYGGLDCDYVFVNLFGGRIRQPLCYPAVHRLAARIAARTGIAFTMHRLPGGHAVEHRLHRAAHPLRVPIPGHSRHRGPTSAPRPRPLLHADRPPAQRRARLGVVPAAGRAIGTTRVWDKLRDGSYVSDFCVATPSKTTYSTSVSPLLSPPRHTGRAKHAQPRRAD